jgi:lysophospholipase L1-like esterase
MAPAGDLTMGLPAKFQVGRIVNINFNDRWALSWCNAKRPAFSYEVRNFRLIEDIEPAICTKNVKTRPLADVVKDMKAGKKVLVTCFGDSITAGTALMRTDKRYAILLGEMLRKEFKNDNITSECVAIGGAHTNDSIGWLDRDLTKGNPDVATMLIGYNNRSGAQTAELYRAQLEMWIERLLAKTEGKTAVILIPSVQGVPRWFAQDDMAAVTYEVAKKYNCTVCPLDKVIGKIGPVDYRAKFLADGIHPNQAGHQIFADELVKCFK